MARILAIDYGKKRCGLAITDPLQIIASPLKTMPTKDLLNFLVDYLREEAVEACVIGWPLHLDGSVSETCHQIDILIKKIKLKLPELPIHKEDERFTSKMAFESMLASGIKKKQRMDKAKTDLLSATLILQSFMSRMANNKGG